MPTPDESLSLFTSVHNREAKQASTGWGLFSAKMDGDAPAHESGAETFTFIASEPKEDRHRDVVAPDWKLDNFRANPVLPWGHESWMPPVGKGLSVDKDEMGRLMLVAQFDDHPVNPKGQLVAHLYREGFLHAVSVGFISTVATHRSDLEEGNPYAGDGLPWCSATVVSPWFAVLATSSACGGTSTARRHARRPQRPSSSAAPPA